MGRLSRIRLCAVGAEAEIRRLLLAMADRSDLDAEDPRSMNTAELAEALRRFSLEETHGMGSFLYDMIARRRYGSALGGCGQMRVDNPAGDLWTVLFTYDGDGPFQPHEWLSLHRECGGALMSVQYGSEDFRVDHGRMTLAGGSPRDVWELMDPAWFWVMHRWGHGQDPREVLRILEHVHAAMEDHDDTPSIPALLEECEAFLRGLNGAPSLPLLAEESEQALAQGDYQGLAALRFTAAERVLWEADLVQDWLDDVERAREIWMSVH